MRNKIDWESQLGRRIKLRDLHVFFAVAERGSMAKAAAQLAVTTPTVSEIIADLEHALGVKLFDRSSRGVEPTVYGRAFLKRGLAAFDELKQGIRDIEFLADPASGALRISCDESIAAAALPPIVQRFMEQTPRAVLDVEPLDYQTYAEKLRDRSFDLALTRRSQPDPQSDPLSELNFEVLFNDEMIVAASTRSRWARRRKIDLAELINERWIVASPGMWNYELLKKAFRARGLDMPQVCLNTVSVYLRTQLLSSGDYITTLPRSVLHLHADRFALKALPVDIPVQPWPVSLLTLKHRTLSPVVERFMSCARETAKSMYQ
jgi:DNA-binding transcriptional LysR family regulator